MPNIAIVWDFDGTLTPKDSTTIVAEIIGEGTGSDFWDTIHKLKGEYPLAQKQDKAQAWQHILAMDAPVWMYSLSRLAFAKNIPLNSETFRRIAHRVEVYPGVASFLRKLKLLEEMPPLKQTSMKVHHFIVSAGLKELVELVLPKDIITWTFGCRYQVNADVSP